MYRDRIIAFLKIYPEETYKVGLFAGLFLCVQAGMGFGDNAAFSLFLSRINVDYLPYMYMGLGGLVFLSTAMFSASLSRFQNASVVRNTLAGFMAIFLVEWVVVVRFGNFLSYALLWLTTYTASYMLGTLLWTTAGEVCDARQAKRLFPLFTSMGILGNVFANLITGEVAEHLGTENLILMFAALLGMAYWLIHRITNHFFIPEDETDAPFSLWNDIRAGYGFVRTAPLFRMIAVTSILLSVLYFTVDFPFSERISETFRNDAEGLAGFKGMFTGITTAITFLVSLLLANRIYTKFGIVNSILTMPLTYIAAFIFFFVSFDFYGAVTARFLQLVVLGGMASTAWNALFNVVPLERRGQVLAFNSGVPTQIGVALSGILIVFSTRVLETQNILLLGAAVALVVTYLTLHMRRSYGDALLAALRAGRVDVFSDEDEAFAGYKDNLFAMQTVLKALQDERPQTRRLAVSMLGYMGNKMAIPDLLERLNDDDASVRVASIRALADLGASAAARIIIRKLNDHDDTVREATLASLPRLGVAPSPELIYTLEQLSKNRRNIRIKAHAAVVLVYLGQSRLVRSMIYRLLRNKDAAKRQVGMNALKHIAEYTQGSSPFRVTTILAGLNDSFPSVRRETIRVFSLLQGTKDYEPVLQSLSDEDARVRKVASETLKQAWAEARSGVVHVLESRQSAPNALDAALDAIPAGLPDILDLLRGYIHREVSNIWYLRMLLNSFTGEEKVIVLLLATLSHRVSSSEGRLIKAVGLFGNQRAFEIVRQSLNSGDANTRAAALETLETLGDPMITKEVLPILDRGGVFTLDADQKLDVDVVVNGLLETRDHWLRAIAARLVPEFGLKEQVGALKKLRSDDVLIVRQAAVDALARMDGGDKMKTLTTLSILDRILLLREVPMFVGLSPEDLEKIAEIAVEQLFSQNMMICREGDRGDSMFIIVSGKVNVIKGTEHGQVVLAVRTDGEFVGEMAILESSVRSATLQALTDARVLVLDGDSFHAILRDRPDVAISMLQHLSHRVRELNARVLDAA